MNSHIRIAFVFVLVSFAVTLRAQNIGLAEKYYGIGVDKFQENLLEQSLEAFRKCDSLKKESEDYLGIASNSDHWIAHVLYKMGREKEAYDIDCYIYKLLPVDGRVLTESLSLEKRAYDYMKKGNNDMAYWFMSKCKEKEEDVLGKDHFYVANSYLNMGDALGADDKKLRKSIEMYEEALRIYKRYGDDAKYMCYMLQFRIANAEYGLSHIDKAESMLPDFDKILPEMKCHWFCAKIAFLRNKNDVEGLVNTGRAFIKSEDSKKDTVEYEGTNWTLIDALYEKGKINEAIEVASSLSQYMEERHGKSSFEYLQAILTQGGLMNGAGKPLDELALYNSSLQGFDFSFNSIDDLIHCKEDDINKYLAVAQLMRRLLSLGIGFDFTGNMLSLSQGISSTFEANDWQQYENIPGYPVLLDVYVTVQQYIANVLFRKGERKKACEIYERLLHVRKIETDDRYYSIKGQTAIWYYENNKYKKAIDYFEDCLQHTDYVDGLYELELAACYVKSNQKTPKINELIKTSYEKHQKFIITNALSTTFVNKLYNWSKLQINNINYSIFANMCEGKNMVANEIAYNSMLLGKSLFLSSQADVQRAIYESNDTAIIELYNRVAQMRIQSNYDSTQAFAIRFLNAESELTAKLSVNNDFAAMYVTNMDDVRKKLTGRSVAVEFVYSTDGEYESKWSYYALVLRNDWQYPVLVKLNFSEEELKNPGIYKDKRLTARIWGEIIKRASIQAGDTIYFAADKELHNIGIENMTWGENGEPISSTYNIYRLTSTRELVLKKEESKITSAVLFGGLDYSTEDGFFSEEEGMRTADRVLAPLPGTKKEIEEIARIFEKITPKCKVECHEGKEGTEMQFATLSGNSPSILHIATHGDYIAKEGENPMENSVLYLSGSEDAYYGESNAPHNENGILTAAEIMDMDLSNVNIAVLSACSTAKGGIGPDGVEGLQRGFKNAGVRSLLMTLWPVNDQATQVLLTEFYSNWILNKMSKHDALEAAKMSVRGTKGWNEPKYWAGFILLDGLE